MYIYILILNRLKVIKEEKKILNLKNDFINGIK
jgi:hypothetical protein